MCIINKMNENEIDFKTFNLLSVARILPFSLGQQSPVNDYRTQEYRCPFEGNSIKFVFILGNFCFKTGTAFHDSGLSHNVHFISKLGRQK